ncbi:MAG TPA: arginine:agmatine antiporter, partial [Stenotrophomonas sp.]|nr:arginine:agmatine antiporter [Stenotrophomonas sp.]
MAEAKKIGVVGATFLVAGNMMGSGVFLLPSSLAKIGTASIWGWLITTAGALLLA